jgi:hypothetical protein
MRTTTIITAKIRPDIYELIRAGEKQFEVRTESFQKADYIRYTALDGTTLGIHPIYSTSSIIDPSTGIIARIASISPHDAHNLKLTSENRLFIALIGPATDMFTANPTAEHTAPAGRMKQS